MAAGPEVNIVFELSREFALLAFVAFGGATALLPEMHRVVVVQPEMHRVRATFEA